MNHEDQDEAYRRWPFLRGMELPEGMWWWIYCDAPCVASAEREYVGWVTVKGSNQPATQINAGDDFIHEYGDMGVEDACQILVTAILTTGGMKD